MRSHIMRRGFWAMMSVLLLWATSSMGEDRPGNAATLTTDSSLRKEPSEKAASLGRLPKGTILTLRGDRKNGFVSVSVELEDGNADGWVRTDALNTRVKEGEDFDEPTSTKIQVKTDEIEEESPSYRPRSRLKIPKDEGILLNRDRGFFYGLQGGPNFALMHSSDTGEYYSGLGFLAGANIGIYLVSYIPIALELGYSQQNGTAGDGGTLQFGFLDVGATLSYLIDRIELQAGGQYSAGLSLNNIPSPIQVANAASLSTLYGMGGIGYRIMVGEITDLIIRARYAVSLAQAPIFHQVATVFIVLQFSG